MAGTILENLSNRKLFVVIGIIFFIQFLAFIIGGLIAPAPSSPEPYIGVKCHPENPEEFSIPRYGNGTKKNCRDGDDRNITFAFQMPLPKNNVILDYSRWMSNMLTLIIPEVRYDTSLSTRLVGDHEINATVVMYVRLGVKNIGDTEWKDYHVRPNLQRKITCRIAAENSRDGRNYDCDVVQLFELQSVYYDYYLINIRFVSGQSSDFGFLETLNMVAIYQNGGFTIVWLALKTAFTIMTFATLFWYWKRLNQLGREANLLEKTLILLGLGVTQLNVPVEYFQLWFDIEFMSFLCDLRQGLFHCSLLIFWVVFIGEHLLDDVRRAGLKAYYKQLAIILIAYVSLFIFESSERGIQVVDPFYSIWETHTNFALFFITITILMAVSYFLFLTFNLWKALSNISSKQASLPAMPTARRMIYQGVIYRFKFLLVFTFVCASSTIAVYILGQVSEDQWYWDDQKSFLSSLQWTSAMFTTVFALWNCYVMTLLILYAPSHKGLNDETDEMSVEFTRLTENDGRDGSSARISYSGSSRNSRRQGAGDRSLLDEISTKQNIQ